MYSPFVLLILMKDLTLIGNTLYCAFEHIDIIFSIIIKTYIK